MKPAQKIGQTLLFLELRGSRRTMIIDVTRFGKKKQAAILHLLTENTQATLNETAREIALGDYRALNRVRNENWVFIVLFLLVIVIRYLIK